MTSRKRTGFAEPEENIKHCQAIAARGQTERKSEVDIQRERETERERERERERRK